MKRFENIGKLINSWAMKHFFQISIINFVLIMLFLLRSAGYFDPYFFISVNFIVVTGLLMSILLLKARSNVIFMVSLLFWLFAGFLRIINLDTWAERTTVYTYQSLILGVIILIIENNNVVDMIRGKNTKR